MQPTKICPTCGEKYGSSNVYCPGDGQQLLPLPPRTESLVGTIINRKYRILDEIGSGGMGRVYLAEQINLGGRRVAIKVLSKGASYQEETVKRFQNEAVMVGQLSHPNIVTIYEMEHTEAGDLFIAMEYVEGTSLRQLLESHGRLEPARALGIARQVARGLSQAHTKGIIHRDIKPENIMVTRLVEGQDHVKVLDFGIAKLREGTLAGTRKGLVLGTPRYMSCEQAGGMSGALLDARSDIYSLGIVLHEMLTGTVPFNAETAVNTMLKHVTQPPPPLSIKLPTPELDEELKALVLRCLSKDRDQRHASARLLSADLERLENHVRRSTSPVPTDKTGEDANRTILMPEDVGIPQPPLHPGVEQREQPDHAPIHQKGNTRTAGTRRKAFWVGAAALLGLAAGLGYLVTRSGGSEEPSTRNEPLVAVLSTQPRGETDVVAPPSSLAGTAVARQDDSPAQRSNDTAGRNPVSSSPTSTAGQITAPTTTLRPSGPPETIRPVSRLGSSTLPPVVPSGFVPPSGQPVAPPVTTLTLPAFVESPSPGTGRQTSPPPVSGPPATPESRPLVEAAEERNPGRVEASRPAYTGPASGIIVWSGQAEKDQAVTIERDRVNTGTTQGQLPGVPCMVRIDDPNVAIAEAPGPSNRFERITFRLRKSGRFSIRIQWEILR